MRGLCVGQGVGDAAVSRRVGRRSRALYCSLVVRHSHCFDRHRSGRGARWWPSLCWAAVPISCDAAHSRASTVSPTRLPLTSYIVLHAHTPLTAPRGISPYTTCPVLGGFSSVLAAVYMSVCKLLTWRPWQSALLFYHVAPLMAGKADLITK